LLFLCAEFVFCSQVQSAPPRNHGRASSIPSGAAALAVLDRATRVARTLHKLHRCQGELHQDQALLEAAQQLHDLPGSLTASDGIASQLLEIGIASDELKTNVIAYDGAVLGNHVESLGELVLRGVMFVIDAQLFRLREALHSDVLDDREAVARFLFGDEFTDVEEMTGYIRLRLDRITADWCGFRAAPPSSSPPRAIQLSPAERSMGYRRAIRDAQRDLRAIPTEARLAPVLSRGWDIRDAPEVHSAIAIMSITMRHYIAIEPLAPQDARRHGVTVTLPPASWRT